MAVTRSTAAERRSAPPLIRPRNSRSFELTGLVFASILSLCGLALTYLAKTGEVAAQKPLLLNADARAEQIIPYLQMLGSPRERQAAAREIYNFVQAHDGHLPNVGAIARVTGSNSKPVYCSRK